MDLQWYILFLQIILVCSTSNNEETTKESEVTLPPEKFEFMREDPANEFGIFATIIAHVHRKANQTTEEWRLNRAYLPEDVFEHLMSRCQNNPDDSKFQWRDCASDDKGLFYQVTWGVPEPKNKTVTYLELKFKPYSKFNERGNEEVCILEEVYKTKAYVVLNTYSAYPANDSVPLSVVDSVQTVHQHQLDAFGENFLSIFEDKIDVNEIYNFGMDEYFDRDPPYECFLSIASSESKSVIEKKCDFFCLSNVSGKDLEDILVKAKKVADEKEEEEDESMESKESGESLRDKKREEL